MPGVDFATFRQGGTWLIAQVPRKFTMKYCTHGEDELKIHAETRVKVCVQTWYFYWIYKYIIYIIQVMLFLTEDKTHSDLAFS